MQYGGSSSVRDSSSYDCGGNCYKQASRFAGMVGSRVLCGGLRGCLDNWSRGKVGLVELGLKAKEK